MTLINHRGALTADEKKLDVTYFLSEVITNTRGMIKQLTGITITVVHIIMSNE